MEQGHDGHALIRDGVYHFPGGEILPAIFTLAPPQEAPQGIQDIEAVLKQAAGGGEVIFGAGRGREINFSVFIVIILSLAGVLLPAAAYPSVVVER